MAKQLIVVFVVALFVLVACGPAATTPAPATGTAASTIPYPEVPRIPVVEARDRWESQNPVIVDVRSRAEYERAHVPDAVHIPLAEIEVRFNELPRDVEIITYCT